MNENENSRKSAALKRLTEHLTALMEEGGAISPMESDMLSLIVSGTLNGENLAQRYPDFFKKMLENAELRQAFLDALEIIEAERAGELTPMPAPETRLDFLTSQPPAPKMTVMDEERWSILWQRPLEQLQAIFSPPELAYRTEQSLIEEPWFTLLRDEVTVSESTYTIVLDCAAAEDEENTLAVHVSLAVTPGASRKPAKFPLRAKLAWGDYQQNVLIPEEGRMRFPNIPFGMIFDPALENLRAGLSLTLESAS
jgi:hypothetical protein